MLAETGEMNAAKEARMIVKIFCLSLRTVCGGSSWRACCVGFIIVSRDGGEASESSREVGWS